MHPQGNAAKEGMRRKPQRWRHQSQSCPRLSTSLPVFYRTSGEVGGKSEVIGAFRVVEKGGGESREDAGVRILWLMFPRFDDALIHNQRRTNLSWANTRLLCLFVDWCIQLTLLKSVVRTILPFLESLTNDFCFIFQNLNYFSKRLICDLWESVRWQLGDSTEFFPGFPIRLTEVDRMRRCLSLKPSPTSQHAKVNKCFFLKTLHCW